MLLSVLLSTLEGEVVFETTQRTGPIGMLSSLGSLLYWLVTRSAILLAVLLLLAFTLLYTYQHHLLYMPAGPEIILPWTSTEQRKKRHQQMANSFNPQMMRSPAEYKIPYENHLIRTEDHVTLHTWLLLQPNSFSAPTLVFFHGNALNIGIRLQNAYGLYTKCKVNILLVDYRGYGESDDVLPSETGLKLDVHAVMSHILKMNPDDKKIDPTKVIVFGRSLGGACAIYAATQYQMKPSIRGLIVENTFTSINDMAVLLAKQIFREYRWSPYFYRTLPTFLRYFMTSHWNNDLYVKQVRSHILFISSARDELIPPSQMHELDDYASNAKRKMFYSVEEGTHNDAYVRGGDQYYMTIKRFIDECIADDDETEQSEAKE